MSERGTFATDRGLFDHPRFAPEPFTEREAWLWMIGQAAFRPHCKRVGKARVTLKRGEFSHSIRFMAERWQWSPTSVRRFLEKLASEIDGDGAMIGTRLDDGVTVVSVCNYDVYQGEAIRKAEADGAENGAPPAQQRHKEEAFDEGSSSREDAREATIADRDLETARDFLKAIGREPDDPWINGAFHQVVAWRKRGFDRASILADAAVTRTGDGRAAVPLSYFVKAIDNLHVGRQQARAGPAAAATPPNPSPNAGRAHAETSPPKPAATWQQSRDNFRVAQAELGAFIEEAESSGVGSG